MNHWHLESIAELHRQEILLEMNKIRLEKEVTRFLQPGQFARTMVSVGSWMVAFGERLQARYAGPWSEAPRPIHHGLYTASR